MKRVMLATMSVAAARGYLNSARNHLEVERLGEAEAAIARGEQLLVGLPDAETAAIRGEFAALRAQIEAMPSEDDQRSLTATKNAIRAIRSRIEDRQPVGLDEQLKKAQGYLNNVREVHRAAVATDLAAVTAEVAAMSASRGTPMPEPVRAPMSPTTGLTEDEQLSLSAAKNTIRAIRSRIEDGQTIGLDEQIKKATGYLNNVREAHRGAVAADLAAVTAEVAAAVGSPPMSVGAAAVVVAAPMPTTTGLTEDEHLSLTAAKNTINVIRTRLADDVTVGLEPQIAKAQAYLDRVPPAHRGTLPAELAALPAEIAAAAAAAKKKR